MPSKVLFNNRQIVLPGAYSTISTNETTPPRNLDYGTCLIISTGTIGANWGGGSGIDGEHHQGLDSVYSFSTLAEFRSFVKGGLYWKLASPLFNPDPNNPAAVGISKLLFVRAAKTTAATIEFSIADGDKFVIKTLDEGLVANGHETDNGNLDTGYGMQIVAGKEDPDKFIMKFYCGSFTGNYDKDGYPINEIYADQAAPNLVLQSPEFIKIQELIDWAKNDSNFNQVFVLDATSVGTNGGDVDESDITTALGGKKFILAKGATESYNETYLQKVLSEIVGLDYSFVFLDQYGDNANSTLTKAYITHMTQEAKYSHFLFVAGYDDKANFSKSCDLAAAFDNDYIQLVHGGVGVISGIPSKPIRWWGAMYNMCSILGRTAGKPPYIPVTNKTIGVDKLQHTLSEPEKEKALMKGVLVTTYNDFTGKFVVLQGVNTLQDNSSLFNSKAQSFSIQFMRIVAQINKELVVNASIDLLGQENGVNVNTLSANAVRDWTTVYLQSRVATDTADNLLLGFQNVNVTQQEDAWFVTYEIRVNNEINKLFFTGFLIR